MSCKKLFFVEPKISEPYQYKLYSRINPHNQINYSDIYQNRIGTRGKNSLSSLKLSRNRLIVLLELTYWPNYWEESTNLIKDNFVYKYIYCTSYMGFGWLCWGLTSQSTIFQSYRDGAIASWVSNQYFRGVKCLAQGHNTAAVGFEPRTSRSGVRHSTTEPPRSPTYMGTHLQYTTVTLSFFLSHPGLRSSDYYSLEFQGNTEEFPP